MVASPRRYMQRQAEAGGWVLRERGGCASLLGELCGRVTGFVAVVGRAPFRQTEHGGTEKSPAVSGEGDARSLSLVATAEAK